MPFFLRFLLALSVTAGLYSCGTAGSHTEQKADSVTTAPILEPLPQPGAPLFLVRSVDQFAGQQKQILHTYLFMLADGGVYKKFPKGDWFDQISAEQLEKSNPRDAGRWRQEDNRLILEWPGEQGMEDWELIPWKGNFRRGQLGIYHLAAPPPDSAFAGRYLYQAPDQVDRELYAVPGFPQVTFLPDGRFEQNSRYALMGQYQNTGDTEKDQGFLTGQYQLNGYQLTLTYQNGLKRTIAVTQLPEEPQVLLLDGHRFLRYQPDGQ